MLLWSRLKTFLFTIFVCPTICYKSRLVDSALVWLYAASVNSHHLPYKNQNLPTYTMGQCNGERNKRMLSFFIAASLDESAEGRTNFLPFSGRLFTSSNDMAGKYYGVAWCSSSYIFKLDVSWHFARGGRFNLMWMWVFFSKDAMVERGKLVGHEVFWALNGLRDFFWLRIG